MPRPIRVKAVGKPIMMTTTMSASMVRPSAGSLIASVPAHAALLGGLVDVLGVGDREPARLLVDIFAVRQLLLDDVDLLDVLEPARPFPGLEADDAAHDLGDALQHHQRAGDRYDR